MRILLVEDHRESRRSLQRLLEIRGHEVVAVGSAEEAEAEIAKQPFPFLILDWMLPGKSGLDLCQQLRGQPQGDDLFILLVTGRGETADLEQALEAGANDYLAWLALAGFSFGCGNSGVWAFIQTLAGPRAVVRWSSLSNGFATFAGVVGPILTGFTVDTTGNFRAALTITAGICLLGALLWTVFVGEFRTTDWARRDPESLAREGAL